jgi:signal transduction histidine kinase
MLNRQSACEALASLVLPGEGQGDTSILRRRVAALTRAVDDRQATIESLVRQLHRARSDPARSASAGSLRAGAAHEMGAPIQRAIHNVRILQRGFDLIERMLTGQDAAGDEELHRSRAAMPGAIERALDDLDRVAAIVRAMENFSPRVHLVASAPAPLDAR